MGATASANDPVLGVLLAGGRARRMGGGDKCLRPLDGRSLLAHVMARAAPQCAGLILNANGDPARFAAFGIPVAGDEVAGFAGPLAGVLAGLAYARRHWPDVAWVATFATDTPFVPLDLVARMLKAVGDGAADLACASSGGRAHPVFGLWPVRLEEDLRRAMVDEGVRKVEAWTGRHRLVEVDFPVAPIDPFFNTNRPDDLAEAERLARSL